MLKVKLDFLANATAGQIVKINRCLALIDKAVNSDAFQKRVLGYQFMEQIVTGYRGILFWRRPIIAMKRTSHFYFAPDEEPYGNDAVLNKIYGGHTERGGPADSTMHLTLIVDSDRVKGVTAYGYPNDDRIYLYASWVDSATDAELSNTIFHEFLHNLGFSHDFERTPNRWASVPYACGDLLEDVIEELRK